jgi:hypothetical protein
MISDPFRVGMGELGSHLIFDPCLLWEMKIKWSPDSLSLSMVGRENWMAVRFLVLVRGKMGRLGGRSIIGPCLC